MIASLPHVHPMNAPGILRLACGASAAGMFGTVVAQTVVGLTQATATFSQTSPGFYPPSAAIDGITSAAPGWAVYDSGVTSPQTAVFETVTDAGFVGGTLLSFTLDQNHGTEHTLGRFRVSLTTDDRSTFADGLATGGSVTANWTVLSLSSLVSAGGATMTAQGDDSVLVSGIALVTDTYTFSAVTGAAGITGFRLEAMADPSLSTSGPGRQANGNFVLSEISVTATAIPEPSTFAAIGGLTVLGVAMGLRRRKQRPQPGTVV